MSSISSPPSPPETSSRLLPGCCASSHSAESLAACLNVVSVASRAAIAGALGGLSVLRGCRGHRHCKPPAWQRARTMTRLRISLHSDFHWNMPYGKNIPLLYYIGINISTVGSGARRIALYIYDSFALAFLRDRSGSAAAHGRRDHRPPLPPPSPARDAGDHARLRRHLHLPARARHRQETAHRCRHLRPRRSRPHRFRIVLYLCCRQADERLPRRSRQHEEVSRRRLSAERALQLRHGLLHCRVAIDVGVGTERLVPEPRRARRRSGDDGVVQQPRARPLLRHLEHGPLDR